MRFLESAWPLLVTVGPMKTTDAELEEMFAGYERYFARGERYALMSVMPRGAEGPGARERKKLAEWAGSPHVYACSKKFCVGSATLVTNPIMQGALTAILWLWKPAAPHLAVRTVRDGVSFCLERLTAERIAMPQGADAIRRIVDAEVGPIV
jgi:hypothetical protein